MTSERPGFRANAALATAVRWLLWASAAVTLAKIVLVWAGSLDPYQTGGAEVALIWGELALYLGTAIAFLVWLYRAEVNARALGAQDMMVGPGWAVGWFFIPLANLVMPFVAVRELWKASATPRDWQLGHASPVIALWWACWIVTSITGNIAFALDRIDEYEAFLASDFMSLVSGAFFVPAATLLAMVVGRIQAMQEAPSHLAGHFT